MMSALPDLPDGLYSITNCLHHNHAALLNGNADEPVRGVFPVNLGTLRDNEKVSHAAAADMAYLTLLHSGSSSIAATVDTASRVLRSRSSLGAPGADTPMVKSSNRQTIECFGLSRVDPGNRTGM